jgi:histidine phosphotransferase ChpT
MSALPNPAPAPSADRAVDGVDLAALVASKLCHDFISPSGAIMSGLDLLNDPASQDMREDALGLIQQSATRMVALVRFARIAFGSAASTERFAADELKSVLDGMLDGGRASLEWRVPAMELSRAQARALVNLAYLAAGALPSGGTATITLAADDGLSVTGVAEGARARLKPEAIAGLAGQQLSEGLAGQWIQSYWLWLTVAEAGGTLEATTEEGRVTLAARLPA